MDQSARWCTQFHIDSSCCCQRMYLNKLQRRKIQSVALKSLVPVYCFLKFSYDLIHVLVALFVYWIFLIWGTITKAHVFSVFVLAMHLRFAQTDLKATVKASSRTDLTFARNFLMQYHFIFALLRRVPVNWNWMFSFFCQIIYLLFCLYNVKFVDPAPDIVTNVSVRNSSKRFCGMFYIKWLAEKAWFHFCVICVGIYSFDPVVIWVTDSVKFFINL